MGGRVRVMMAGGAPLSPDTHEQIKICLCADVVQGYGLTETTSGATVMDGKQLKLTFIKPNRELLQALSDTILLCNHFTLNYQFC